MRFLLDENLHELTATVLTALGTPDGDTFVYLTTVAASGTSDDEIPSVCASERFDALITVNHRDFGAKRHLYQSLMEVGVHVVFIRPGKIKFRVPAQVSLLSGHYLTFRRYIEEAAELGNTALVRLTPTTCERRTLDELIAEMEERQSARHLP